MNTVPISDEAVVALARYNFEAEQGDGTWERCPVDARPGWIDQARAQCEVVACGVVSAAYEIDANALRSNHSWNPLSWFASRVIASFLESRQRVFGTGELREGPEEYAARFERAANDPARIEKRKGMGPGMTVPRRRVQIERGVVALKDIERQLPLDEFYRIVRALQVYADAVDRMETGDPAANAKEAAAARAMVAGVLEANEQK